MPQSSSAPAIAANRFGLGARAGELEQIGTYAPDWLIAQLKGAPPVLTDTGLRTSQSVLAQTIEVRREQREAGGKKAIKQRAEAGTTLGGDNEGPADDPNARAAAIQNLLKLPQIYRPIYVNEATARLR